MGNDVAKKLKVKEGDVLLTMNAPSDFSKTFRTISGGMKIVTKANEYSQVHWFVSNQSVLNRELNKILKLLKNDVLLWIYYPKTTSKIQTDLTRDKGWDSFLKHKELRWISLISFDETWSAFACRLKTEKDERHDLKPKERPILNYIDKEKKSVRLPDDFSKALQQNKKLNEFFNALSFTNRKEYVEWIITARREETRTQRITGSLQRLAKGWKNPSGR